MFKSYEKFRAFTSEGVAKDDQDVKRLKVVQTACSDSNSYFLFNSGAVYATGANDRWQCSEIEEAKADMDLIDEDYLRPARMDEKELAERGGAVIPECAAEIIKEVQRMQSIGTPYLVPIFKKNMKQDLQIKQISAGAHHVLAVSVDGQCYGWGDNEYGQLGLGRLLLDGDHCCVERPTLLKDLLDKKILMTASGRSHSLFLSELGQVYAAGYNEFGQLGIRSEPLRMRLNRDEAGGYLQTYMHSKTKPTPQRVEVENIRFIAAGDSHSLAISDSSTDGKQQSELYSWGWGAFGQLGHSKIRNSYNLDRPKKVKFRDAIDTKIAFVAAGSKHTICIDLQGRLWYFGCKLSVGIRERTKLQFEPVLLQPANRSECPLFEQGFVLIDADADSNIAICAADNSVHCFGQGQM